MKSSPKNKRALKEVDKKDSFQRTHHKPGTKPARKAKKFEQEMMRKSSKG
jgi:hypothetical protein